LNNPFVWWGVCINLFYNEKAGEAGNLGLFWIEKSLSAAGTIQIRKSTDRRLDWVAA
jgi:hypothetical protein